MRLWQLHDSLLNHKYLQLFQRWTRHKKNAHMEITFWNFSTTIYQGIGTFPWRYSQPLAHFAVLAALGTPPGARNRYCTCDWHGTSGGNAWMDEKPGSGPNIVPPPLLGLSHAHPPGGTWFIHIIKITPALVSHANWGRLRWIGEIIGDGVNRDVIVRYFPPIVL